MALATAALSEAGGAPADAAPPPPVDEPLDDYLLLRDHVRGTFAFNRTSLAGHAIGAIIVEMVFASAAPRTLRVVWGVAFAIVWLVRAALAVRFARDEPDATSGLDRRLRVWQAGVLASGVLWGAAAWFFSPYGSGLHQLALVVVVYTFCVACVPILAPQFRLFVLYTAWTIDKHNDYRKVRKDIAAIKVLMPGVLHDVAQRSIQVHGALGVSNEMPFHRMVLASSVLGLADGPTEVHKVTVARQVLREHKATDDLWPTSHLPKRLAAAREKYAEHLEHEVGNL